MDLSHSTVCCIVFVTPCQVGSQGRPSDAMKTNPNSRTLEQPTSSCTSGIIAWLFRLSVPTSPRPTDLHPPSSCHNGGSSTRRALSSTHRSRTTVVSRLHDHTTPKTEVCHPRLSKNISGTFQEQFGIKLSPSRCNPRRLSQNRALPSSCL